MRSPELRAISPPVPPDSIRALVATEKARVRALALGRRDGLADDDRLAGSALISDHVLALAPPRGAAVAAFLPIRSEVDLAPAIAGLEARGHPVGLPVMAGAGLVFRRYRPGDDLVPLGFGTRGPGPAAPEIIPAIVLMPLSAFDRAGGRVGYGRGYYDRTIAHLKTLGHFPRLIGIAFSVQEVAAVPMEDHDVPLDMIITERDTIRFT